jgi:hypothetical protein
MQELLWRGALVVLLAELCACRGRAQAPERGSAGAATPSAPAMRVEPDEVAFEGRWLPVEAGPEAATLASPVRLVCKRAAGSCQEKLTRPSKYPGAEPVEDDFAYRVTEWTRWGQPAGRLVATRRDGTASVEIRLSLSGLVGEKSLVDRGTEVRWRLE